MRHGRFAAHIRRRRGLWIAGGVLALLLVPYVTAFYTLRRTAMYSFMYTPPDGETFIRSHRVHSFLGGPKVAPALYNAFIPIHQWCFKGDSADDLAALTADEMHQSVRDIYVPHDPNW